MSKEIIKDIQDECIFFEGNCIGGINDLENKEIYEGDILEDSWKKRYPVEYTEYKFDAAGFYNTGFEIANDGFSEGMIFKVIGNIYDNPELEDWN